MPPSRCRQFLASARADTRRLVRPSCEGSSCGPARLDIHELRAQQSLGDRSPSTSKRLSNFLALGGRDAEFAPAAQGWTAVAALFSQLGIGSAVIELPKDVDMVHSKHMIVSKSGTSRGSQSEQLTKRKRRRKSPSMKKRDAASRLKQDIAQRLRDATEALGKIPAEVARMLDIPEPSYHRYQSGAGGIPHTVIADLDRVFGITPSYLYTGRESDLPDNVRVALAGRRRRLRV